MTLFVLATFLALLGFPGDTRTDVRVPLVDGSPYALPSLRLEEDRVWIQGPALERGMLLVGPPTPGTARRPAGVEIAAHRAVPFVTDAQGRACVPLPALALRPGFRMQAVIGDGVGGPAAVLSAPSIGPQPISGVFDGERLVPGTRAPATLVGVAEQGRPDSPDAGLRDSDLDGIDGNRARAIFVDFLSGTPGGAGTMAAPLSDLQTAIDRAAATPGKDHVYVSAGIYAGPITLRDGVSVWGGYDAASGWRRALWPANETLIHNLDVTHSPEGAIGVRGAFLSAPAVLGDLTVEVWGSGFHQGKDGEHVFGIHLQQVSNLRLERVIAMAGLAGWGADGAPVGLTGATPPGGGGGGAGGTSAQITGIQGGNGGGSACALGGLGGFGGAPYFGGIPGVPGSPGLPGAWGTSPFTTLSVSGPFLIAGGSGTDGSDGCPGAGGGGGGGGGYSWPFGNGGNGGAGGGGGRAGQGARAGLRGGSSIGLFLAVARVEVVGCTFAGYGGGLGGFASGPGFGTGGAGGNDGQTSSGLPAGGKGGGGGSGGPGGEAGCGNGGDCYGILAGPGSAATIRTTNLDARLPGAPGLGILTGHAGVAQAFRQL